MLCSQPKRVFFLFVCLINVLGMVVILLDSCDQLVQAFGGFVYDLHLMLCD